ncbi:DUF3999 family protein [Mariniflexile jejuense]|uniref:DUF3999 family protein n=1 Tax=Mariniflexile jejuense TaxID=1173582 RepID=A0ABW3JH30_9FLAO
MKTSLSIFIAIFTLHLGFSQSHKGTINPVTESGLHKVLVSPEIRSASKENTSHFRILDANNKEVPYAVLNTEDAQVSEFISYIIQSHVVIKDSVTSLMIANDAKRIQNKLVLQIANTSVNKHYDISGSNDAKQWFGLVSNATLINLNNPDSTFVEKTISFPSNQYQYLRIDFKDKKSLPINVLAVGEYNNTLVGQQPIVFKGFKYIISENAKEKVTTINFKAANAYQIDGIAFNIKTPSYFRNAQLLVKNTQSIKNKEVTYDDVYVNFQFNSAESNIINLTYFTQKQFSITIENKDNQPLEITDIILFQNPLYVVTNLKADQNYTVVVDSTYNKPSYDLVNFIPATTNNLPEARIKSFTKVKQATLQATQKAFWQTNAFMWGCISIGVCVIGYFAMGMLKDMKG